MTFLNKTHCIFKIYPTVIFDFLSHYYCTVVECWLLSLLLFQGHGCDTLVEDINVLEWQLSTTSVSALLVYRHIVVTIDNTIVVAVLENIFIPYLKYDCFFYKMKLIVKVSKISDKFVSIATRVKVWCH